MGNQDEWDVLFSNLNPTQIADRLNARHQLCPRLKRAWDRIFGSIDNNGIAILVTERRLSPGWTIYGDDVSFFAVHHG